MRYALALCLSLAAAFAADDAAAVKEVTAAAEQLRTAMLKGERTPLERLLSNDLTYEHSSAKTETKAEVIANNTNAAKLPKGLDFHDGFTRVFGNTAVYKGRLDLTNSAGAVSHLDVLMVWVKLPRGWQLVARQSTKVE